jgi:hypothetical protein
MIAPVVCCYESRPWCAQGGAATLATIIVRVCAAMTSCHNVHRWAQLLPPRQDDSSDSSASSDESDLSDESDESDSSDVACEDHEVHPMVMNIGYRPTVEVDTDPGFSLRFSLGFRLRV